MPVDVTALNATIAALATEMTRTESTEDSAGKLIAAQGAATAKAVTDALAADKAVSQATIDAANKAIADVTARFAASDDKLGTAVATFTPPNPPA